MGKPLQPHSGSNASSDHPGIPQSYRGSYERVVDRSGRAMLPSDWRAAGESHFLCLVWPLVGNPEKLVLLPPGPAAKLHANLEDMPLSDAEGSALATAVAGRSYEIKLDGFGRLPIPEAAAKAVGIKDRIRLVGGFTRFELWNPGRHDTAVARPEFVAQVERGLASRRI